jgi:uncharacterized linocin/CFP29 family protein
MQRLSRVGKDTAQLTDEELRYIDTRVVETVRPLLIGRRLFPVFTLPHAGFTTVRGYKETDMTKARISLHGQGKNKDRIELASFDVIVPVLHKEFTLFWRDVLASRGGGLPLETRTIENAARKVAEDEDHLLITGENSAGTMPAFPALGIEGLATATGRNTKASAGAWGANALTDLSAAIGELETDGHMGPYAAILRASWAAKLRALVANTAVKYIDVIAPLFTAGVHVSDSLCTSAGATTIALVVEPSQENFEMVVGQDLATFTQQDDDMNLQGKVFEVLAPRIKRPTSVCEITGLT